MRHLEPLELVLLAEASAELGLQSAHARAPAGRRSHGVNVTLLSAMSLEGMLPGPLAEGGATVEVFAYCLAELLPPALAPGQILAAGNFVVHHNRRVRELAAGAGAGLLYLLA